MNWLKENWFKAGILAVTLAVGFYAIDFFRTSKVAPSSENTPLQEQTATVYQDALLEFEEVNEAAQTPEEVETTQSVEFDVDSDKQYREPPFDWTLPDAILPTMNDTLNAYREGYIGIKATVREAEELQDRIYEVLADTSDSENRGKLLEMVRVNKEYIDAGWVFVGWLEKTSTYYERLISAINSRDEVQYHLNSEYIDIQEAEKETVINDFLNKEKIKQDYGAILLQ